MIRTLLKLFGYKIIYKDGNKEWEHRYDGLDHTCGRPIHYNMSVAPPWAKIKIIKE